MNETKVFFNGEVIPSTQAKINIADPGFLHGASIFTTMLARNGVVFRFERHLERLADTIRLFGLNLNVTIGQLVDGMYGVLDANGLADARCRITLTPGPSDGEPTTLITADTLPQYPPEWYHKGISVVVTALKQTTGDPTFGYKTGCYMPRIMARQEAAAKGAEDALWYTTNNHLAESCFSNVFLVLGGKVMTPPRDTPVLPGIVREVVLELCDGLGLEHDAETPLTVQDMLAAEEIFLTSSTMGIRPVVLAEKHQVGDGNPGLVTKKIMAAYSELLDRECSERQIMEGTQRDEGS